ncbi:MAG: CheY-like chemotaxis protein [Glaciecola sp.]|jgi:CheY-like chemotaxis protein
MKARILCVDDDGMVLSGLRRTLRGFFDVTLAEGPELGLKILESNEPFAVVLSDMRMPGMDGAEFLAEAGRLYPDMVRMMLTGNSDLMTAVRAVNEGNIFRFLNKPCGPEELTNALEAGVQQHNLICAERQILEETLNGCVKVLSEILSITDPESFRHSDSIKRVARDVAEGMQIPRPWEVEMATMLAHLGRVTIPAEVLAREASGIDLEPAERKMMDAIPEVGAGLIRAIPRLQGVAEIVTRQRVHWKDDNSDSKGAQIVRTLHDMKILEDSGLTAAAALGSFSEENGAYDPAVVAAIAAVKGVQDTTQADKEIRFEDLRPGDVLAAPLLTIDGRMMLREGQVVGQVLLQRLCNHHEVSGFQEPIQILGGETSHSQIRRKAS